MPLDDEVSAAVAAAYGTATRITQRTSLAGGSINQVEALETSAGRFILKTHANAPTGFFEAEAAGLRALAGAGTSLVVPRVIAIGGTPRPFLVLEHLGAGRRGPDFDDRLGRGLADLHRATAPRFGFDSDNFCGATPQNNPWTDRWLTFYGESRLGCQVRLARDTGRLSTSEARGIDELIGLLDQWISEPPEGPALIHGDLWSGNLHVTDDGRPALIDPAVSFSHREAELGMMTLFGGISARVFAAYDEAFPLEDGWRERNKLYELYHLLNHLNLFGDTYKERVMRFCP